VAKRWCDSELPNSFAMQKSGKFGR
jgi:hypothetical protein